MRSLPSSPPRSIVAVLAQNDVVTCPAAHKIVSKAGEKNVGTISTNDCVIAGPAIQDVVAVCPEKQVGNAGVADYFHSCVIVSGGDGNSKELNIGHACGRRHRRGRIDGAQKRKLILDECGRWLRADHFVGYRRQTRCQAVFELMICEICPCGLV